MPFLPHNQQRQSTEGKHQQLDNAEKTIHKLFLHNAVLK